MGHILGRDEIKAKGYRIDGDCFSAAAQALLAAGPTALLVHGEVAHAELPGVRYAHAWVEYDEPTAKGPVRMVWEVANGRQQIVPRELYYRIGQVVESPGRIKRYGRQDMFNRLMATHHYGPWDLDSEL